MKKFTLTVQDSTAALLGLYFMSKNIMFEAEHIPDSAPNSGGAVDNGVQHTQPEIFARAADDWFAINNTATIRQAFIAGARYAQKHPASA